MFRRLPKCCGLGPPKRAVAGQLLGKRFIRGSPSPRAIFDVDPDDSVEVFVNGDPVTVPKGVSVLQACEAAGINVPRFCYHDRLSVAGNCRMCLVEVEKAKKPVASCAMPIMPGMKILTDTDVVKIAREGVMEFLLANHPLDCPICDQGGECDLQDQSMAFGAWKGRYREAKRAVEDKNLGPLVKTVMTRCIHCTRCVRYSDEICGTSELGTTGRGNATEIGTYIGSKFDSEISGNVIDLCPVGALTNKPFAFRARPWELTPVETIDVHAATGDNISVDVRGTAIIRVKSRLNEEVNEEWISDKTRFSIDGIVRQRLDQTLVRDGRTGEFKQVTWPEALEVVAEALTRCTPREMKAVVGDQVDAEAAMCLKDFFNRLGCDNTECRQDGVKLDPGVRSDYLMNPTIPGIEDADTVLLVGCNPRMEAPILNARLRKSFLFGTSVSYIGNSMQMNYDCEQVGTTAKDFVALAEGTHPFSETLTSSENPIILIGMSALIGPDAEAVKAAVHKLMQQLPGKENSVGYVQTAAGRTGALDLGFVPGPEASDDHLKFVYLLGADEMDVDAIPEDAFVVYQGSHGDAGANRADVILPGVTFAEKNATYVNMDGRVQRTKPALTPVGYARQDWQIIRALSEVMGNVLPYDNLEQIRERMAEVCPSFGNLEQITPPNWRPEDPVETKAAAPSGKPFSKYYDNFYQTCPITRNSRVMARASAELPLSRSSWL